MNLNSVGISIVQFVDGVFLKIFVFLFFLKIDT